MCCIWETPRIRISGIARSCFCPPAWSTCGRLPRVAFGNKRVELAQQRAQMNRTPATTNCRDAAGFSLLEMMMAIVVLIIGLGGVAQLVPASLLLNSGNRMNSSSLVLAQRELDQMVNQPLISASFTDAQGNFCDLGDLTKPNQLVGSPIVVANNRPLIDFSQALVINYSYPVPYTDPN